MSKAYISWVDENLPNAQKVFDHFHVIKLMNDKLDKIRRRTAKEFDEEQKDLLKNQIITIYFRQTIFHLCSESINII